MLFTNPETWFSVNFLRSSSLEIEAVCEEGRMHRRAAIGLSLHLEQERM
jgi:hypothetical protein